MGLENGCFFWIFACMQTLSLNIVFFCQVFSASIKNGKNEKMDWSAHRAQHVSFTIANKLKSYEANILNAYIDFHSISIDTHS